MSKEPRITVICFREPVDFLGHSGELSWRDDRHGPDANPEKFTPSRVSFVSGLLIIKPIGDPPPGADGKPNESARWRTAKVPITSIRYWHESPSRE